MSVHMNGVKNMEQNEPALQQQAALWRIANRRLTAKALAELSYEQALRPEASSADRYLLKLSNGIRYRFSAVRSIWDFLLIDVDSLRREQQTVSTSADNAAQFFIDAAADLELNDVTLGVFLHELANTLAADMAVLQQRANLPAEIIADLPDEALQALLDGHPKAVLNKGRIGWGAEEFARYGTESASGAALIWLAVKREAVRVGMQSEWSVERLLQQSLDSSEQQRLMVRLQTLDIDWQAYLPMPVHPWQWQHHIRHQFAGEIAAGRLRYLGAFGDAYLPLQSLRTLANAQRPACLHIKLPITVLNTSCYRGIPGQYIETGAELSAWMATLCANDPVLKARGTIALQEVAGIFYPHPEQEQVANTPYRYREMLGAIWRQSPAAGLQDGERPMLLAALLQTDKDGRPLIEVLIRRSGLSTAQWLSALFDAVVVPLYHLMCRYGIGLVAHAQNLTLILDGEMPVRVALKDFHGDLRMVDKHFPEHSTMPEQVKQTLTRLPAHYLIHDLQTGHFVTVLRFLSALLWQRCAFDERQFYALLAEVLRRYQASQPELSNRFAMFDLFTPTIARVCINRVRFRIGYHDNAERPLPMLAGDLDNPLWMVEQTGQNQLELGGHHD
ncbi:IucA/IucC family siderophore biosynthesis protein [Permianibacter aggregans]|uniref:Aerobactin synthase n=2 Tax=Permianibacter aggregans TaxID=1510150 RepID=A0A4R6URA3_9GAMM|nr:IucA/IucC family siderophore biosynthesis protein [Permianibacter aggregans]TDQ48113.1 aerobactin synthase [Permianibacter aggregans]